MATTRAALTEADIRTLVKGRTPDARAEVAARLCLVIDNDPLSDEDRAVAHEILRVMAADAAEMVRRAMAVALANSAVLPRDVAMKLARDVESVCLPVLSFSPAFTDEDLVQIVRLGGPVRQVIVAQRPKLSEKVTAAIVAHGNERAVEAACANDNALFAEATLQEAIDRFARSERVLAAIAYRAALPLAVTERLIELVGEQLRDHLINTHALSAEAALDVAVRGTERAVLDLVDQAAATTDVQAFVGHLHRQGRLSASLLLRALAHGDMTFFEWGLAELAGVPHHRTWLMIHDAGRLGLRAIYERAGLPARLFPAFRAGVDTFHSMEFDGGERDRERFQERMLQRFLTQSQNGGAEDADYLLERMDRVSRRAQAGVA